LKKFTIFYYSTLFQKKQVFFTLFSLLIAFFEKYWNIFVFCLYKIPQLANFYCAPVLFVASRRFLREVCAKCQKRKKPKKYVAIKREMW